MFLNKIYFRSLSLFLTFSFNFCLINYSGKCLPAIVDEIETKRLVFLSFSISLSPCLSVCLYVFLSFIFSQINYFGNRLHVIVDYIGTKRLVFLSFSISLSPCLSVCLYLSLSFRYNNWVRVCKPS